MEKLSIPSNNMSWTEIEKGHFQRPIGENEAFIKWIGDAGHPAGHEHWAINVDVKIRRSPRTSQEGLVERLKTAWQNLRFQVPNIAAIAGEKTLDYTVPDEHAMQEWLSETFMVERNATRGDITTRMKPARYVLLHYFPEQDELLLHTSHWRTDGIGIMYLLNAFLDLAGSESTIPDPATLLWGEEASRLAPSLEDALGLPMESSPKLRAVANTWTSTFFAQNGAVGLQKSCSKGTIPRGTTSARSTFSEKATKGIIAACKERGISVTAAGHASIAAANWAIAPPEWKNKHYASTIRFGMRPYLDKKYSSLEHSAALYSSGYQHCIPPGRSFADNAAEYNRLYRQGLNPDFVEAHRQYELNLVEIMKNYSPDSQSASNVDISSIGVLDKVVAAQHGVLEVEHIGIGVDSLTPQMGCFFWTFRGLMCFNLVYNEAFFEKEIPERFLEEVKRTLVQELGVEE